LDLSARSVLLSSLVRPLLKLNLLLLLLLLLLLPAARASHLRFCSDGEMAGGVADSGPTVMFMVPSRSMPNTDSTHPVLVATNIVSGHTADAAGVKEICVMCPPVPAGSPLAEVERGQSLQSGVRETVSMRVSILLGA
jgi:hypothetical protein